MYLKHIPMKYIRRVEAHALLHLPTCLRQPSTGYGKGLGDHSNKLGLAESPPHLDPRQARDPTFPCTQGDVQKPPQFHRNVHNNSIQRDNAALRWRMPSLCASTWCAITVSQQSLSARAVNAATL